MTSPLASSAAHDCAERLRGYGSPLSNPCASDSFPLAACSVPPSCLRRQPRRSNFSHRPAPLLRCRQLQRRRRCRRSCDAACRRLPRPVACPGALSSKALQLMPLQQAQLLDLIVAGAVLWGSERMHVNLFSVQLI